MSVRVPRPLERERTISSKMMLEKPDVHMHKNEVDLYFIPSTKVKSKWIKDLNLWANTINLEEYIGANLQDLGFGNRFLNMITKA